MSLRGPRPPAPTSRGSTLAGSVQPIVRGAELVSSAPLIASIGRAPPTFGGATDRAVRVAAGATAGRGKPDLRGYAGPLSHNCSVESLRSL